jgi:hypothetical protein
MVETPAHRLKRRRHEQSGGGAECGEARENPLDQHEPIPIAFRAISLVM